MKVKFCGAARNVTGSAHLITLDSGFKILLDCGLFQGKGKHVWESNNRWYFDPKDIDAVVLSHAHIDHTGRLPQLVKDGFNGNIYATHATRSLASIMLLDSAKIQERDVEYYNQKLSKKRRSKNKKFRHPLYTSKQIPETLNRFIGLRYDTWFDINDQISIYYSDAGHLLGSASVTLKITENDKETLFGFTGDIGRWDRPILKDPLVMPRVDYLICESTYGDKNHESNPEQSDKFLEIIKETCLEKKGKLIIPAFSVGRTQEIVYMLDKLESSGMLPKLPVYVDSPLAVNATQVFGNHPECFDNNLNEYLLIDENPFGFNDLKYVRSVEESKAINSSEKPCIILSSSGMMNAGRIRHHLYNNIDNEKNTFLIVGYCSPETAGGRLRAGATELRIFGETKEVLAEIKIMDSFSAHADRDEMIQFLGNQDDSLDKLFLVHGDYDTQQKFKTYLEDKGFGDIYIPQEGATFEL